jgi:hypothetical protein
MKLLGNAEVVDYEMDTVFEGLTRKQGVGSVAGKDNGNGGSWAGSGMGRSGFLRSDAHKSVSISGRNDGFWGGARKNKQEQGHPYLSR